MVDNIRSIEHRDEVFELFLRCNCCSLSRIIGLRSLCKYGSDNLKAMQEQLICEEEEAEK